jgi:hypothetical protein
METNPLVGTWRLVSWENRDTDGTVTYPMGRDAQGFILYNPDGYMAAVLAPANRPAFAANDIGAGSGAERAAAAATFLSYCGRYELLPGRVRHHVEASLFPNWVGTTQERFAEWQGDRLTLSTAPTLYAGHQRVGYLVWQRV